MISTSNLKYILLYIVSPTQERGGRRPKLEGVVAPEKLVYNNVYSKFFCEHDTTHLLQIGIRAA